MAQCRLCHPLYSRCMMKDYMKLPVLYMRGGTSKGAYLYAPDLPTDPTERDAMILSSMGVQMYVKLMGLEEQTL